MCFMPKLLIDGQTSHSSLNLNLLSKYRISTTMHQNLQMDHTLLLCQRCLKWVRKIVLFSNILTRENATWCFTKLYHFVVLLTVCKRILHLRTDDKKTSNATLYVTRELSYEENSTHIHVYCRGGSLLILMWFKRCSTELLDKL